jgi:proton-translocating NADH-quinone oxidoreductase chain N
MGWPSWIWLIAFPIVTSPLVYIAGRIVQRIIDERAARRRFFASSPDPNRKQPAGRSWAANPIRWIGLAVLLLTCVPFAQAWRDLAAGNVPSFTYGIVSLRFDGIGLLLAAAVLILGILVSLFSGRYIGHEGGQEKYHALLNAMIGAMIGLGCAADLFNLWVWFETMAVASYMLVSYHSSQPASLEAGVKYLVQSSVGSVLVLLGIGIVFSQAGTLDLGTLRVLAQSGELPRLPLLAAGALFCIGFGVKVAMVPLHTWLPDAHSMAPSGISAMLSGVVIEAGLVALLRAFSVVIGVSAGWGPILLAFGAINMLVGNLLALRQTQVKRMLAFSSLSHVGYMLLGLGIAVSFGQLDGAQGGFFHLLNHTLMKGLAFLAAGSLLFALRLARGTFEPLTSDDLAGASRRYPLSALALSVALLGLGGLPPFAGFMSKWQIFASGFRTGSPLLIGLVIFALLNSLLSLGYYAPLVSVMYRREPSAAVSDGARVPMGMAIPLVILIVAIIVLGVWPALANVLTEPAGKALLGIFGKGGM